MAETLGARVAQEWRDEAFAQAWIASDQASDLLQLPMAIAAALVAQDRPDAHLVVDIGSGPGTFLATVLDALPNARGIWNDASEAMEREARHRLAPYGDRVAFRLGDMADVDALGLPDHVDAITTSRALHHLDPAGVAAFYRASARHLAPDGWLVNLDHVGPADEWNRRFRGVRPRFNQRPASATPHKNDNPLPTAEDHFAGLAAAGMDAALAWKAFFTCLFVARRDGTVTVDAQSPR